MKKIIVVLGILLCILSVGLVIYWGRPKTFSEQSTVVAADITIEWRPLSAQAYSEVRPWLDAIKPLYAEATLSVVRPYVYANEPRLKSYPMGKSAFVDGKVNYGIRDTMKRHIIKRFSHIEHDVQHNNVKAAYIAVAKVQDQIVGFMLLEECSVQELLNPQLKKIIEGTALKPAQTDQIYISLLAVLPEMQRHGIGRKLVSTICQQRPHIKQVYVATSADSFNNIAQTFCEHVGFKKVFTGEFVPDYNDGGFEKQMIVYGLNPHQKVKDVHDKKR